MEKYPAKNDVAVILLFFTRKETLSKTFEVIRACRPTHLFLYQDGPRNEDDRRRIEECRKVVSDDQIDWQCDVQRSYQTENSGAYASNYNAQTWGFSLFDKCVYLEDDSTPSLSFIPFCKEMLDRYENDERITMITGFNTEEQTDYCPYDYFFSSVFSIWGWASWRRVVSQWDGRYTVLDDAYNLQMLEAIIKKRGHPGRFIPSMRKHRAEGRPIYETVYWSCNLLNSGLSIVPRRNMVCNSGFSGGEASNFSGSLRTTPHRLRKMLTMPSYDVTFPLKHPRYVIEDTAYLDRVYRILGWGRYAWVKIFRSVEELLLNLRYGNLKQIRTAFVKRYRKMVGSGQ
jgi:hypothetical protein